MRKKKMLKKNAEKKTQNAENELWTISPFF